MYARGMTVREIQGHLADLYGLDVSPDLISAVTDAVLDEIAEWQDRPLEPVYPLVFFDALRVKIRDEGTVCGSALKRGPTRVVGTQDLSAPIGVQTPLPIHTTRRTRGHPSGNRR